MEYFLGVSLGQMHEFTALAILEATWHREPAGSDNVVARYAIRHLERFALGTPYPDLVDRLKTICHDKTLAWSDLVIDRTGVGKPVVKLFKESDIRAEMHSVVVTTGHESTFDSGTWMVPKLELVGTLQVLLQSRRLKLATTLPEAGTLVQELTTFRAKPAPASNDPYLDWREGPQDDLVLAVAIAAWRAERSNFSKDQPTVGPGRATWWTPQLSARRF